ncbi:PqqD family protein [Pyxidicoccus parkwayensis]|uniref:PqqD family protein n=1 Tax=Pyxidicoccus parkwayensis TaxID=2813578 RepID=A0ABX7P6Z4_9BACT|nr:PqqD family protein [Pyxidicoccus parkwaysis]QSQ26240.1 PqqD family protein [Pyxidicoccus parkwaysis]
MSAGFRENRIPRPREGVSGQRFGSDYIVLDADGNTLRGLNPTAIRVWELCDGTRTARDVAEQVAREYKANVQQVLDDTLRFLTELARLGLIDETQEVL